VKAHKASNNKRTIKLEHC